MQQEAFIQSHRKGAGVAHVRHEGRGGGGVREDAGAEGEPRAARRLGGARSDRRGKKGPTALSRGLSCGAVKKLFPGRAGSLVRRR